MNIFVKGKSKIYIKEIKALITRMLHTNIQYLLPKYISKIK